MLNNIPHIKAYRMNFGDSNAFLALNYGADDVDGTVGHEEIMHEAGSTTHLSDDRTSLAQSIIDEDLVPIQRNSLYSNFKKHIDDDDDNSGVNLPMARLEV
jgi:aminodeoxyfutalosine synthase